MTYSILLGRRHYAGWLPLSRMRTQPFRSVLVIGPTQSGKTSRVVIPSVLRWKGPMVVTSVKDDVTSATLPWRERHGPVLVINPSEPDGVTWDPLEGVSGFHDALHVTRELFTSPPGASAESQFWNVHAAKLSAAVICAAVANGGTIDDVVRVLESHLRDVSHVDDVGANRTLESFLTMEPKTLEGVISTALAVLEPWTVPLQLGRVRDVLRRGGTVYLCAPRSDHRRYESLFRGAIRSLIEEQERLAREGRAEPLLVVLDEAASIAPLSDLDQMAATLSASRVTLLSVFQDAAQIQHRWGSAARTLVNNHSYRVVFHGTVDPTTCELLPELVPDVNAVASLRRGRPGSARLLALHYPPTTVRCRPWFSTSLRRRVPSG